MTDFDDIIERGRPIRVTYLITDLEVGGVPLHLYRLVTSLPSDRVRVRVISLADEGPVGEMLREAGVEVFGCGADSLRDVGALWRLWRLLRSDRVDVLHALLFHANQAARLVGPLAGIPVRRIVCEIQTAECERRWHLVCDNMTCRLCRCEIGNSPSVVEHLHRFAHIPIARLRCAWGGVDVSAIGSAKAVERSSLGLPEDVPIVIWTGRLDPVKGFEEMLAGFARGSAGGDARLLLVGEGGYRGQIERLIRENALSGRVMLLGRRSDVPGLLKMADVFLFCSRTEGLPNSLAEAMAAGLPVVATDVPGCRDLIVDGETGLLVQAGSPAEIGSGLSRILGDAELRRLLGSRARGWVSANLDSARLRKKWLQFYEKVRYNTPRANSTMFDSVVWPRSSLCNVL